MKSVRELKKENDDLIAENKIPQQQTELLVMRADKNENK
jgi:hypothetical protein